MNIPKTPLLRSVGMSLPERGIHILAQSYPRGTRLDLHMHREAQFVFAADGLMQVETPRGRWLVPPDRAVWVPPMLEHAIDILADVEMRTVYFRPEWLATQTTSAHLSGEFVVRVSSLLREVVLSLFDQRDDPLRTLLLAQLALTELDDAGDAATFMPMPSDTKARRVAEIILNDPAGVHELELLGIAAGISGRTLSRLFPEQTGMTLKTWRQRARIMAAIEMFGRGQTSIKLIGAKLGFSSSAAFSHAFREVTGETPTTFISKRHPA